MFARGRRYRELAESMREHVDERIGELIDEGVPRGEAEMRAKREFGNFMRIEERSREVWQWRRVESLWADVRYALRRLRKAPGFAVTAVLMLALGIGATTAIFTLVEQVMLRSLPVAKPEQLWRIGDAALCCYTNGYTQGSDQAQNDWNYFSWEAYKLFRAQTPAFVDLAAFQPGEGNAELAVRRAGSPAAALTGNGEFVSGNFFRTFGIAAWRGRVFTDGDDAAGAAPVAVMSFRTWREKCGSDPSVVGGTYQINGHAFTVIGVTPPGFFGAKMDTADMPDMWLPLATEPMIAGASSRLEHAGTAWLDLIGRVRPGTNAKTLEAQLQGELQQWLASHVSEMSAQEKSLQAKQTLHLTPGGAGVSLMRAHYQDDLRLLLLAAVCVLLVACANLANLLLARGLKDRQQTAVRVALGASRVRLVRKALIESMVLAVIGGGAGIAVAYGGAKLILHLAFRSGTGAEAGIPVDAAPSLPVLLFVVGISLVTGMVFGMAPAWMSARAEPVDAMRGANRTVGGRRGVFGTAGAQKTLVIVQAAVSLTLLSMAAMLGQSLRNLEGQDFGFDPGGRYLVSIDPKLSNYSSDQLVPLFREIEARARAIPGVRSVGSVLEAPPGGWMTHEIRIEGQPEPGPRADVVSGWTRVTPGFFPTYQDRMVRGRAITEEDNRSTRPVAVVNESFEKRFFGRENPIGQHFGPAPERNAGMYEIVGVAADVVFGNGPQRPVYLLPEAQSTQFAEADTQAREVWSYSLYNVVIWAPGNHPDMQAQVKRALEDVDPNLVLYDVASYADVIRGNFAQQNMMASLTWLFGGLGLVLAAVGLYGVTAYGVEQRTSEIGVRMALGADRGSVIGLVLRGAFLQAGIGLALGIPAAIGAGILMANRLFGVRPWDPVMLCGATLLLGAATLVAAVIPARRAAGVDPMVALRSE